MVWHLAKNLCNWPPWLEVPTAVAVEAAARAGAHLVLTDVRTRRNKPLLHTPMPRQSEFAYKSDHPFEKRAAEAARIREK